MTTKRVPAPAGRTASKGTDWHAFRDELPVRRRVAARKALVERYEGLTVERPELAQVVGAQRREEPLFQVVPYKEAFSPYLVRTVLDHVGATSGALLDPFSGAGTSVLVAAERGISAVGVDLLPFAAFAGRTLLRVVESDWSLIDRLELQLLANHGGAKGRFPNFPVGNWAFTPAALGQLTALQDVISELRKGPERDVLRLALLCCVEEMSQATKDGTSLRRRPHGRRDGRFGLRHSRANVRSAFSQKLALLRAGSGALTSIPPDSDVITGDARCIGELLAGRKFDVAVCSPPYPNRYDYVSNYQLELGFGFVDDVDALRRLRKAQLRSHLEAPWADDRTLELDALDEFLAALLASKHRTGEVGRVFRMVSGYFEDMSVVLAGMRTVMRPGAHVIMVVGTQVFANEALPTDLLVAEIAELHGYAVKEIWIARRKGIAVQQRQRVRRPAGSRESVLLLACG